MGVLDINGGIITNTKDIWNEATKEWSLISVGNNKEVTIKNGTLKAKENDAYAVDVQGGTVILENIVCYGNITAVYVYYGTAIIKSGEFYIQQLNNNKVQGPYGLLINCYDPAYKGGADRKNPEYIWKKGDAKIIIYGGKYHGFDPANNEAEGDGTSFLAEGYKSVALDEKDENGLTVYEVVKDDTTTAS